MSSRRASSLAVLGCVALASCTSRPPSTPQTAAPAAAPQPTGVRLDALDRGVDPCTDLYEFAGGAWRKAHPIPEKQPRWGPRAAARGENQGKVAALLTAIAARTDWPVGSTEAKLSDFVAACTDEAGVDKAGLTPLERLLAQVEAMKTPADLQAALRSLQALGVNAPFTVSGAFENSTPLRFSATVVPGPLGLPSKDPAPYRAHVAKVLELAGASATASGKAAEAVVALEKRLAQASLDPVAAADPAATEHLLTFEQLQKLAPHVDWARAFDEAGLARGNVNVAEPKHLERVDQLLQDLPVATWKAYLRFQLLESASPWLAKPFADEAFRFHEQVPRPRLERCLELTQTLLPDLVAQKYVERHFPPAAKAKVTALATALLAELKKRVAAEPWLTPQTRTTALAKLAGLKLLLGSPEHWKDHAGLQVRRDALWANVAAARKFGVDDVRRLVGHPTPTQDYWQLPAFSPDAYLDLQLNQLVLPAGFLQPPLFDPAASDAVNLGSFGVLFAHDLTHGIDVGGAALDAEGRPVPWWTEADKVGFEQRARCVADQFEATFVEPGLHHDGQRVKSEAVGDLIGARLALEALQTSLASQPQPTLDGFTPQQQLFIAWAQARSEAVRPEEATRLVAHDSHPISKYRFNVTVSNLPEFERAFGCQADAGLVRPAAERCEVW